MMMPRILRLAGTAGMAFMLGTGLALGQVTQTVQQTPKAVSVNIPQAQLAAHLRDMDAKRQPIQNLIQGNKYTVNIRRARTAEAALVHPVTANVWVITEGAGTLVTGGVLASGRIDGGRSHRVKAGDLIYIPSGLPHAVSGVEGGMSWLDVRWDTDWPPESPMGAGTLAGLSGGAGGSGARGAQPGSQQSLAFSYGGSGEMIFTREFLDQIMAGMRMRKSLNTRLIEGGRYNINLRWNGTPTNEVHEQTIDTWYVLAGGGTVNTGFDLANGARVPGTGVSKAARPGDVFFHPSNLRHGFSEVSPDVFWLNIRWDDNYAAH